MTKINFKNNKKTALTMSVFMIVALMVVPSTESLPLVSALQSDKTASTVKGTVINKDLGITDADVEKLFPGLMSDSEKVTNEGMILNNTQIKQMLDGKTYKFMGIDYVGNVFDKSASWKPEFHINVGNTTEITVSINRQINQVETIQEHNLPLKLPATSTGASPHGFASNYITTTNVVDGISMVVPYINHNTPGTSTEEFFMLNAASAGHNSPLCSASSYPNSYFAQVGFEFDGNGVKKAFPIWTDTLQNCLPQYSTAPYTANHSWFFKIYTYAGNWVTYGVDQQDGTAIVSSSTSGQTYTTFNTSDPNTSIFFENTNKGTSWYSEFVSNPSAQTLQYHNRSTNTWNSWPSASTYDQKTIPAGVCNQVVSGSDTSVMSFSSGTVTWSMYNMATQYPAC